jgi:hypothetical protein
MPSADLCISSISIIIALWILLVGGMRLDEMIVGSGVLLLSAAFLYQIWRTENLSLDLTLQDLVQGWRVPGYICSGAYEIIAILLKDLFRLKRADSFYRFSGFKTSKSAPRLVARRVLAIFYTTMAPNFIVIGIDFRQSRMLFHQLERSDVPRMTKALGARPGASRI